MKTYRVDLVFESDGGRIRTKRIGRYRSIEKAMKAAKRAAGRNASFVKKGIDMMYVGPNGAAYFG